MMRLSCCPFDRQTVGGARESSHGAGDSWIWVATQEEEEEEEEV